MEEEIKSVSGKQSVVDELFNIIKKSESYTYIVMEYFGAKWGDEKEMREFYYPKFAEKLEIARESGVDIKIIGSTLDITRKYLNTIKELPGEKRTLKYRELRYDPIRFIISDDYCCLLVTSKPYTEDLIHYEGLLFDNKKVAKHFKNYFFDLWSVSQELTDDNYSN